MMINCSKLLILKTFLGLFACLNSAFALETKPVVALTHPQVKWALESLISHYNLNLKATLSFKMSGSAHNFEPSMKDLKKLSRQKYLIAGPTGHQKWIKKSRKLLPKNTIFLNSKHGEHFWLNSKLACKTEKVILDALKSWNLVEPETYENYNLKTKWCLNIVEYCKELQKMLQMNNITHILLAHGALKDQLQSFKVNVLVLFDDDHHSEVTTGKLKKALKWQNTPQMSKHLLQIREPEINWPTPLKTKKEGKVHSITWSPMKEDSLKTLKQLLDIEFRKKL